MRVNGLYGHVRRNDARSLALFAGFIAAFHVLAALAFLVPLAMFDPDHAPIYGWTGYVTRWAPILTLLGALLFALQMAWHVRTVRLRTDFRFVDDRDEPRLCRIVEPLAIAAGLPTPYVGVIDSPALNAFACGIRKKDAVLVFTRGLIDTLDDDELAAVAAHEIVHIVNGDIRTIAATNVCLDTLRYFQQRPHPRRVNRVWEALTMPLLALTMPLLVVLLLLVLFLRRLAVDGSHLARLLIASAREFIADAESVRLTQNPAALVSALRRIEGKSAIPGLAAGQDAMMIDGAHEGAYATHPTIAERVAALVAVTGSMALIAPARRDTRPPQSRPPQSRPPQSRPAGAFGHRPTPAFASVAASPARKAAGADAVRASAAAGFNRLGLTREMTFGAIAAIAAFLWAHGAELGNPSALAKAFDPAPVRAFFAMGGQGMKCQVQGIGWLLGVAETPTGCDDLSMDGLFAGHGGEGNLLGMIGEQRSGVRNRIGSGGTFSSEPSRETKLAEVRAMRCFQTESYSVGDRGLRSVADESSASDAISLPRYLGLLDDAARRVRQAAAADRDAALLDYFESRKTLGQVIHRFFGEPGLGIATTRFAGPDHGDAVAALRQRVADLDFAPGVDPLQRAELELLAATPSDFIPCNARRART